MKYLLAFLVLASCTPKPISLKGSYSEIPAHRTTSLSFPEVLAKTKAYLLSHGMTVREYSEATGEIITDRIKVPYTTEDKKGILKNPAAHIVCALSYNDGSQKVIPVYGDIYAEWSISVTKRSDSAVVTVAPVHVMNEYVRGNTRVAKPWPVYRSTGVFEKGLLTAIEL